MPLELQPLEETDLDAFVELNWQAFKTEINSIFYPNGLLPADREHVKQRTLNGLQKDPETEILKIVDTDLPDDDPSNKIVGLSRWKFHPHERSPEELAAAEREAELVRQPNVPPAAEDFRKNLAKSQSQIIGGKPHVSLQLLATHPNHHRRGVGTMHLRWGIARANERGLPIYLEASTIGKPLYERMGFETVGLVQFDARNWGSSKEMRHTVMFRPAGKPLLSN